MLKIIGLHLMYFVSMLTTLLLLIGMFSLGGNLNRSESILYALVLLDVGVLSFAILDSRSESAIDFDDVIILDSRKGE